MAPSGKAPRFARLRRRGWEKLFSGGLFLGHALFDHAEDVALLHDQEVFAVDYDLGARPLAEQHAVADPNVDRDQLASLITSAGANRNDFALGGLFLDGVGDDDAAGSLLLGCDAPGRRGGGGRRPASRALLGFR